MWHARVLPLWSYTAWTQGIIFAVAPVAMDWVSYDYWEVICAIGWQKEKQKAVFYVIVACIVNFLLPGLVMIFCYTRIIQEAKKNTFVGVCRNGSVTNHNHNMERKRAIKTITSLIVVCSWLFHICHAVLYYKVFKSYCSWPQIRTTVCQSAGVIHAILGQHGESIHIWYIQSRLPSRLLKASSEEVQVPSLLERSWAWF